MGRMAAILLLVTLIIMGDGCSSEPDVISIVPKESAANNLVVEPLRSSGSIGIGDAKVWVGTKQGLFTGRGYYPGARIEHVIPIYNSYSQDVQVELFFESSSGVEDGYVSAPSYTRDWVTFEKHSVIPANSMKGIPVTLQMPKNAEIFAEKWEFRITVMALGQGKMQTAVSQRWLVTMR